MAHTGTSKEINWAGQRARSVTVTWDNATAGTPAAIAHGGPTDCDVTITGFSNTEATDGASAFTPSASIDEANGELDAVVSVETGGSCAGATTTFILVFAASADQDGSSISQSAVY